MTSLIDAPHQLRTSWSESISLASTDVARGRYRRSASVSCLRPGRHDVRRREGVRLGLAPTPTAFAESVFCYVGAPGQYFKIQGSVSKRCTVRRNYAPNLVKISHNLVTDTGHRRPDTADNFIFYPMLLCIVLDRK